jgi:hypothetical protein
MRYSKKLYTREEDDCRILKNWMKASSSEGRHAGHHELPHHRLYINIKHEICQMNPTIHCKQKTQRVTLRKHTREHPRANPEQEITQIRSTPHIMRNKSRCTLRIKAPRQ